MHSMVAELFHADRRVDGWIDRNDKANSCFLQLHEHIRKLYQIDSTYTLQAKEHGATKLQRYM